MAKNKKKEEATTGIESLSTGELKKELSARKLPVSNSKTDMAKRLKMAVEKEAEAKGKSKAKTEETPSKPKASAAIKKPQPTHKVKKVREEDKISLAEKRAKPIPVGMARSFIGTEKSDFETSGGKGVPIRREKIVPKDK